MKSPSGELNNNVYNIRLYFILIYKRGGEKWIFNHIKH
jgi:hypothetical protein